MINREIVYERNVTGSFMKIPAGAEGGIDERLMLRRKISGVLPVEKAYVDGNGQYWYNISGKQSLDTYCRVKEIQMDFVEQLIISICGLMERLEWNLIDTNCLMLDPELVFISNANQGFLFTLYPGTKQTAEQEFQMLMEYLMKKVDHKDTQAVRAVYRIYEQTLEEGYLITDIRSMLLREKSTEEQAEIWNEPIPEPADKRWKTDTGDSSRENNERPLNGSGKYQRSVNKGREKKEESIVEIIREKFIEWGILQEVADSKRTERIPRKRKRPDEAVGYEGKGRRRTSKSIDSKMIVYPDEIVEEESEPTPVIHPTVCLMNQDGQPKGELRYTGSEGLCDIQLTDAPMRIGYGADADIRIDRETISQFHARIHKEDDGFYIEDLNSTNGTFINEELLVYREQRKLIYNDIVQFADIRYRFC